MWATPKGLAGVCVSFAWVGLALRTPAHTSDTSLCSSRYGVIRSVESCGRTGCREWLDRIRGIDLPFRRIAKIRRGRSLVQFTCKDVMRRAIGSLIRSRRR
jgi:hypothetical protein